MGEEQIKGSRAQIPEPLSGARVYLIGRSRSRVLNSPDARDAQRCAIPATEDYHGTINDAMESLVTVHGECMLRQ
jgi:hypothetical protein